MEVPVTEAEPGKGRKRKKCPEKWKANLAKKAGKRWLGMCDADEI